jgi:hypothetical protein
MSLVANKAQQIPSHDKMNREYRQKPEFEEIITKLLTSNRRKLLRNAGLGTAFAATSGLGLFRSNAGSGRRRPE